MNKNELVAKMSEISGLTKADSQRALDAFTKAVEHSLSKSGDVRLVGFGTFSVVKRAATTGRNPRTGAVIKISASKRVKFKAGKGLVDSVN